VVPGLLWRSGVTTSVATHLDPADPLLQLVSSRVGIVRNVSRLAKGPEEPTPPFIYQAELAHFDFRRGDESTRTGSGKGATEEQALASAIGEAVERYCSAQPDPNAIVVSSAAELGPSIICPPECVLYSERQYAQANLPYRRFDEQAPIGWVRGRMLPDNTEVFVPAHFAFFQYAGEQPHEYFCPQTSSGAAAGSDLDSAILHGLCELIERDGFLINWLNRLPAPRVDISGLGGVTRYVYGHYARQDIQLHVFNLTTDIPAHVMMCIAIDESLRGPFAVVGLGCHLDPIQAVTKAVLEVCQVRPGETVKYRQNPPQGRLHSYADVRTLHDHSAFFSMAHNRHELSFLFESPRVQHVSDLADLSTGDVHADLERCVEYLRAVGCRVAFVETTTPDIGGLKIRVVSTFATGLQPMHFGFGQARLGGHRLYEVPCKLGYRAAPTSEDALNPCPHPLA
jgi:ribosomal protein S12 methylthiotransferase accessory factor